MKIFIPTRDRIQSQFTWDNLPVSLRHSTMLVCPPEEVEQHLELGRNVLPRPPLKLSGVRQWLVDTYADEPAIIMCDDDLSFFVRKSPDAHNLRPADSAETHEIFARMYRSVSLGEYAHVGLSPRQGNNWLYPAKEVKDTRMNAVHCVSPATLISLGVKYDEVDMMEDYHVTLSLFEKGFGNMALADAAWDQNRGSGAPGGFSHYRTSETQKNAAERLAELHPDSVKVVVKKPKTGAGDFAGERVDVRVQWKKTAERGRRT